MRTTLLLLSVALALTLASCESNKSNEPSSDVPCICGTDEAILDGCAHPLCLAGETNPDNPDCVCGRMEFDEEN